MKGVTLFLVAIVLGFVAIEGARKIRCSNAAKTIKAHGMCVNNPDCEIRPADYHNLVVAETNFRYCN